MAPHLIELYAKIELVGHYIEDESISLNGGKNAVPPALLAIVLMAQDGRKFLDAWYESPFESMHVKIYYKIEIDSVILKENEGEVIDGSLLYQSSVEALNSLILEGQGALTDWAKGEYPNIDWDNIGIPTLHLSEVP